MIRILAVLLLLPLVVHAQERIDVPTRPGIAVPVTVTQAA